VWPSASLAVLVLLALCGCGGSGSSGFDAISEASAVTRAVERGSCVEFDGTTYCGSDAARSVDGNRVRVRIDTATTPRSCTPRPAAGCPPSVPVAPDGFPDGTVFRAAIAASAEGPWTLVPIEPGTPPETDPQVIRLEETPPPSSLVAVLAYVQGLPDDIPTEAPLLADFRADAVYVHDPFEPEAQ
jgi:hypothetical protein